MLSRIYALVGAVLLLALGALFFATNSSYQDSLQGRVYYFLGEYEQAYVLSKQAYEKDPYNKMAFTVYTQSKIAKTFLAYIRQGEEYLGRIEAISAKESVSEADRSRIKLMCEVMMDAYETLSPSPLTSKTLQKRAHTMFEKFKQLHQELF